VFLPILLPFSERRRLARVMLQLRFSDLLSCPSPSRRVLSSLTGDNRQTNLEALGQLFIHDSTPAHSRCGTRSEYGTEIFRHLT
jgi:hypothetical protein